VVADLTPARRIRWDVFGVLIGFFVLSVLSTRLAGLSHGVVQRWSYLVVAIAAWVVATWGAAGPFWGAAGFLVFELVVIAVALSARSLWLVTTSAGVLAGVAVAATWGHHYVRAQELARQAACEAAEQQANALQVSTAHLETADRALQARLQRYTALRLVTESLSAQVSDLDVLLSTVAREVLLVLDHADLVLVYLIEMPRHELALRAVHQRRRHAGVIQGKTGDLCDQWVLRQRQPLLIRDVRNDFRFPTQTTLVEDRDVASLIAAPVISAQRVLGVLRAESAGVDAFSGEDLRLLDIVADLAAMAIENMRLYLRMAELAITDDLTGLTVHRYFRERLEEELARARAHGGPVSVLLIDLDHFKAYNDTYGHPAGDKLLRAIARTLHQRESSGGLVARYGGEEFAILLNGATREGARVQAEQIRAAIAAQAFTLRQGSARVTVSIGVASFPEDGRHPEHVLQAADQRLYQAKARGRNQVCGA